MFTTTSKLITGIFFLISVCSDNESAKFMLQCIQEGAADYVLKPLREDVLKTMFLVRFPIVTMAM